MKKRLVDTFNQKSFDRFFVRQRDDFSCVPASLATIARLQKLDRKLSYEFFRKTVGRARLRGCYPSEIRQACEKYLPDARTGFNAYRGGVALAYIRHKPDGEDHAVVFLARKSNEIVYYDPMDHKIYRDNVRNMRRSSLKDGWGTWTASFPEQQGAGFAFWSKHAEPNPYPLEKQRFRILQRHARKAARVRWKKQRRMA